MPDLSTDLVELLKDGHNYDFTLVCDGGEQLKVHRLILGARSEVFKNMTDVDMEEKSMGMVRLKYFDVEVVKEFVNYLYSDKISENFADLEELLKIGHQYLVSSLVDECSKRLSQKLTVDNVVPLGSLGETYGVSHLSDKCAEFIFENFQKMNQEKLNTAPAPLLRKALAASGKKGKSFKVVSKTQYETNFFTNLAVVDPVFVKENTLIETHFKVSRKTKLAGIGLYWGVCSIPIEYSLFECFPEGEETYYHEETLMTVKTEVSSPSSRFTLSKLMFPIPAEVTSGRVYVLQMKPGQEIVYNTCKWSYEHSVSVQMAEEKLEVNLTEASPQIPVLYFED